MYLINTSLKNIKTITLLLICFISFYASANDVPDFIETKRIKADLGGDIKREVYEAGGYKGFADGDDLVVFDPDFIK